MVLFPQGSPCDILCDAFPPVKRSRMTTDASIIGKEKDQVNQADSDFLVGDFTTGGRIDFGIGNSRFAGGRMIRLGRD